VASELAGVALATLIRELEGLNAFEVGSEHNRPADVGHPTVRWS
jgi:hypothetical protein